MPIPYSLFPFASWILSRIALMAEKTDFNLPHYWLQPASVMWQSISSGVNGGAGQGGAIAKNK